MEQELFSLLYKETQGTEMVSNLPPTSLQSGILTLPIGDIGDQWGREMRNKTDYGN